MGIDRALLINHAEYTIRMQLASPPPKSLVDGIIGLIQQSRKVIL